MRILGLDYGSKTVGVAVSDPLGVTAQRLETIWRKQENKLLFINTKRGSAEMLASFLYEIVDEL